MAGEADIAAIGIVRAPPEEVFGFLSDLENHWRLADRFIVVVNLERGPDGRARGGRVRMRGPLGLSRTATTSVLAADVPGRMLGVAEVGGRTRAFVRWKLSGVGGRTRVRLDATIDRTGWVDRLLLLLGGHTWLERRFSAVLRRLGERFSSAATDDEGYVGAHADAGAQAPIQRLSP